jgi:hypothetical protein
MREELRSGEEVIGGRGKGVLISATIQLHAHELFGSGISGGTHSHIGGGESADVVEAAGNAEVGQDSSAGTRTPGFEQDVGGFYVAVQQASVMRIVKCFGNRRDDLHHFLDRHPGRVAFRHGQRPRPPLCDHRRVNECCPRCDHRANCPTNTEPPDTPGDGAGDTPNDAASTQSCPGSADDR